jgi:hemerythrin
MEQKNIPTEWLEDFNVNVKFIDEQHQYFFKVLKELEMMVKSGSCKENISGIFFSMVHYADHYLIQEEIYFKELNYEGLKDHHIKHDLFVSGIINLKDDYATGKTDICETLLIFMTDYFHDHILGYDIKAVEILKEQGTGNNQ